MRLNDEQRVLLAEWQDISIAQFERYADRWASGELSLSNFEQLFKLELKNLYVASAWTATGSIEATNHRHYGVVGRRLRDQYQFMHNFFNEIEAGNLTLAEIKARSAQYARSSRQVLERIGNSDVGLPMLPAYPADGSTECLTNCKCSHRVVDVEDGFDVYWKLNPAEHCPDCTSRAKNSPIRVRFGRVTNPDVWAV